MKYMDRETCGRLARRLGLDLHKEDEVYVVNIKRDDDIYIVSSNGDAIFDGTLPMVHSYLLGFDEGKLHGFKMKGYHNA